MSGLVALVVTAVVVPLLLAEATDWCRWLSFKVVRWSAGFLGDEKARKRYAEEWEAAVEEIPGKLSPLLAALGIAASVPKMRSIIRASQSRLSQNGSDSDTAKGDGDTAIGPELTAVPAMFGPRAAALADSADSTVQRLVLGGHLRRLRELAFITTEEAGYAIRASRSKISRLEHGRAGVRERDIEDLLTLYGVNGGDEREALLRLAREPNTPGWWQGYSDILPHWVEPYFGLEAAASVIKCWEAQFVPSLLQTDAYAQAIIRLGDVASEEEVARRAEARLGHRSILYLAIGSPFTILRFPEPDLRDVVYIEQLTSAIYLDKPLHVECYARVIEKISLLAPQPAETPKLLSKILKAL